jgi:hypothetical protein
MGDKFLKDLRSLESLTRLYDEAMVMIEDDPCEAYDQLQAVAVHISSTFGDDEVASGWSGAISSALLLSIINPVIGAIAGVISYGTASGKSIKKYEDSEYYQLESKARAGMLLAKENMNEDDAEEIEKEYDDYDELQVMTKEMKKLREDVARLRVELEISRKKTSGDVDG